MRTPTFHADRLLTFLRKHKIATLDELKTTLGTHSTMTIFRKLKQLQYLSSCSHGGKYYTLKQIVAFDQEGLWRYKRVLFSEHGSLKETIKVLIERSLQGYTALEMEQRLSLKPNATLAELAEQKAIYRTKISGRYVYFAENASLRTRQELSRRDTIPAEVPTHMKPEVLLNEVKAAIILFYSSLNEKERRLYAGLESLKIGRGGDQVIAELLGLDRKTIARGRNELLGDSLEAQGTRKSGGGRKCIQKKRRH